MAPCASPESCRWKVLLDEGGEQPDSEGLAKQLAIWSMRHGEIAFAIGDAYGHDPAVVASAQSRLSLGRMTLPHQAASSPARRTTTVAPEAATSG
jgi:23S rRNA pseudoU1915 N3-methylase RlmH